MNYFERFDLERKFDIDIKHLKKRYLVLQSQFHPDKANSEDEKMQYLNLSIEINEGYKVLIDDLLRAEYLLKLSGVNLNDEQRKAAINQNILSQALEDREVLEELNSFSEL